MRLIATLPIVSVILHLSFVSGAIGVRSTRRHQLERRGDITPIKPPTLARRDDQDPCAGERICPGGFGLSRQVCVELTLLIRHLLSWRAVLWGRLLLRWRDLPSWRGIRR
jgi:hypothetical protein